MIWLPRIANFTDFDPLLAEPTVRLRFVKPDEPLGCPDAVILPGSKSTIADLQALQQAGMVQQLEQFTGVVVGICGGLQMLGSQIADPEGLEGSPSTCAGLSLLAAETQLDRVKITQQRTTEACWPVVTEIQGYEIHQGITQFGPGVAPLLADPDLGAVAEGGRIWGSYLHGIFENHTFRRHWLNDLRARKGIPPLPVLSGHFAVEREALLDRLATTWDPHLNLGRLGI
ncbi:MAG: hypothetical protein HC924_11665 [Synechococcaceae cyanobacterium SM2_3_2]|nr:hypothetical protein [Synechococcaceae cyanobacterium SM2_3_2]